MIKIIMNEFEIHEALLEKVCLENNRIIIELDDISQKRHTITLVPYQAIKITTFDCVPIGYYFSDECVKDDRYRCHILEMTDSPWIKQLKKNTIDKTAKFLNASNHYVIPLRENIIEVVAHKIEIVKKLEL